MRLTAHFRDFLGSFVMDRNQSELTDGILVVIFLHKFLQQLNKNAQKHLKNVKSYLYHRARMAALCP